MQEGRSLDLVRQLWPICLRREGKLLESKAHFHMLTMLKVLRAVRLHIELAIRWWAGTQAGTGAALLAASRRSESWLVYMSG